MKSLTDTFKDIYCSNDSLDENHSLTYYMDFDNSFCYESKKMGTYKVELQKYGLTHGGSFEMAWGHPSMVIMHEEELNEKENSYDYRILNKKFLSTDWYSKIIGKITPDGISHPTKNKHYWSIGKRKKIEPPIGNISLLVKK